MNKHTHGRVSGQVRRTCRQLFEDQELCFGRLLPVTQVQQALDRHGVHFRQCLYTPLVTLWTFLYQVLSADQCCRAAVARLLARLGLHGAEPCSAKTDPYCKARQRLPEALIADLARSSGQELHNQVPAPRLLQGRPIKLADGTTVSMPDTPANQQSYPQPDSQQAGLGFPLLRLVALISLSCGAVLDVAMGPYAGKKTGETSLLRQMLSGLRAGDVLLADSYFGNYWIMALLLGRGVDVVSRHDGKRRVDFRQGRHLGRQDHVVSWPKPKCPAWMEQPLYQSLPEHLEIRELRVGVYQRGFRVRWMLLITTLLDAGAFTQEELAEVYRLRWHAELDMRSIKVAMQMDILRCKTPAMVRKEICMHLLAYNLVRKLMAQAAATAQVDPRQLSFKGAMQTVSAFAAAGVFADPKKSQALYQAILQAVASHRVGDRPDRSEPRAVKRRPKGLPRLQQPRAVAKARLLQRS
jgi:hypothetical protein